MRLTNELRANGVRTPFPAHRRAVERARALQGWIIVARRGSRWRHRAGRHFAGMRFSLKGWAMKLREIAVAVAALSLAGTAMAAGNDTRSTTSERMPTARQGQPLDQSTQAQQEPQGASPANSASTHGSAKMDNSNASNAAQSQGGMANEEHDTQLVQSVQQALKQKGYDVGTIDGQWGTNTQDALRQFQQSQGITQTGNLDAQTLSALGVQQNEGAQGGTSSSSGMSPQSGMSSHGGTSSQSGMSSQGSTSSSQGTQGSRSSGQGSTTSSIQGSAYK
jgi:His-Xaa-Ser repeat protein HxsA